MLCNNFVWFTLKCLSIGTPKPINFPFVPNGKLMFLGDTIFKYIRVAQFVFNPIALRKAKIVYNFVLSECNRVYS